MSQIKSLADNSVSTSPTSSNVNVYATGTTPMQVILGSGEQVTIAGLNGGNPITTSPFNFNYSAGAFPSGISPVVTTITPSLAQSVISFGSVSTSTIALIWTSVTNATNYVVRRSLNSSMTGATQIYTGTLLGFTDSGLTAGTTYYYTVTASAIGYSSSISEVSSRDTNATVGRVFNVGTGSGDLLLDGLDNSKSWFPLQNNDTFRILGTGSNTYNNIYLKDMGNASIQVNVTNQTGVIKAERIWTYGTQGNARLDFYQKVSGVDFGVENNWGNNNGEKFIINSDSADDYTLIVRGIRCSQFFDKGWQLIPKNKVYNNGAGKSAAELIDIQYCVWTDGAKQGEGAVDLGGDFYSGVDNCFVRKFIFSNNLIQNGDYGVGGRNVGEFQCENNTLISVNPNTPAEGTGTYHKRTLDIFGWGYYKNISAKNSYGVVCRSVSFARGSTKRTNVITNIISDTNTRYSAVEINEFEADQRNLSGIATAGFTKVNGVTIRNLGTAGTYTSTCVDIFGSGNNSTVRNCVAVNPFIFGSSDKFAINGPVAVQSNNVAYADNNLTKLNLTTYKPAADSVLKGAGIADVDFTTDIYGQTRLNPPTIGAVEAV